MKLNICFFAMNHYSEIAEKPNLTWLDAAQVSAIYSSYFRIINNIYRLLENKIFLLCFGKCFFFLL